MPGGLVLSPSGSGASNSTPPVPLSGTGGWFYHTSGGQGPAFLFYIAHRNRLPGLPQGMLWRTPEHGLNAEEPAADQIRRPFFPVRPRLQFFWSRTSLAIFQVDMTSVSTSHISISPIVSGKRCPTISSFTGSARPYSGIN